ncbi:MAG: beta-lactamase family protein [Clostridia bacterium]|nr:beta-lactamase family protein [Clostridia bacterium]
MNQLTKELSAILSYSLAPKHTSVSYAIMKDGEFLAYDALGTQGGKEKKPATPDCTYNVCSVSKIYCSVAVMQLVEKGLVDLDTPIVNYLPRFKMLDPRHKLITLRHCLSHTSGLPGTQWKGFSVADVTTADYYEDVYNYMAHSYLKADPGEYAVYCNDGFTMAEMVVAAVTGEKYEDYCQNNITDPIEAYSSRLSANINPDYPLITEGEGVPEKLLIQGGGGYTTSMRDLCKFGMQFLNESKIISQESKDEMAKKQGATFLKGDKRSCNYGLGWDTVCFTHPDYDLGENVLVKGGNSFQFTTQFIIIPKYNAVLAISETHDCRLDVQDVILRMFGHAMLKQGINIYKNIKPIPQKMIDKYDGTWLIPSGILNLHLYGAHANITVDDSRGGHRPWGKAMSFDGKMLKNDERTLTFEDHKGDTYAISSFNRGLAAPMAQKARDFAPLSDVWKSRIGKKYLVIDANTYDIVINDIMTGFTINPLKDVEGVLVFSFSGRSDSEIYGLFESCLKPLSDSVATGFLRTPSNPSRDLLTSVFEVKNGAEYCNISSFTYRDVETLPYYEGQGFGEADEENKAYRFGYQLAKLPEIPEGRRLMVMDDDLACVYDSLVHPNYNPIDKGYILFI